MQGRDETVLAAFVQTDGRTDGVEVQTGAAPTVGSALLSEVSVEAECL